MQNNLLKTIRNGFNAVSRNTKIMLSYAPMTTFCVAMLSVPLLAGSGGSFTAIFPLAMSIIADAGINGPALKSVREDLRASTSPKA